MDSSPLRLEEARQALTNGTGKGVRIAVLDSGIEIDHPELVGLELIDDLHVIDSGIQIEVRIATCYLAEMGAPRVVRQPHPAHGQCIPIRLSRHQRRQCLRRLQHHDRGRGGAVRSRGVLHEPRHWHARIRKKGAAPVS